MLKLIETIKLIKDLETISKNKIVTQDIENSIGNIYVKNINLNKNERLRILSNTVLKTDLTNPEYKGYPFSRVETYDDRF